jgi:CBS domain-containing protein
LIVPCDHHQTGSTGSKSEARNDTMIVKKLPRALERLSVIEAGTPVNGAATLMSEPHTDLIVVCDCGDMVGFLTKTDIVGQIRRCMASSCTTRADSIMTRDVTYCRADDVLLEVRSVMRERGVPRVPILDEARRPLRHHICAGSLAGPPVRIRGRGDELLRDYVSGVGYR